MELGSIGNGNISPEVPGKKGKERQGCGGDFLTGPHQTAHSRLQPAQAAHNTQLVLSHSIMYALILPRSCHVCNKKHVKTNYGNLHINLKVRRKHGYKFVNLL